MKTISDFRFQNAETKKHFRIQGQKSIIEHRSNNRGISSFKSAIRNPQSEITKGGFTLIELMAVIAIILLLASIMIPNIVKNVERGREARAKADIDILVKAISLFQIDNGRLPGSDLSDLWDPTGQGPYISTPQGETPWGGSYSLTDEGGSYKIIATDSKGEAVDKVTKKITFDN